MATYDSKKLSRERFGKYGKGYVTSATHAKGFELERLIQIARPDPDWVVLDVATGGGHTALKFAPVVAHVTATDLTPGMLEAAQTFILGQGKSNVDFRLADAEDLPFENEVFDLVTCRVAPHHFPNPGQFVKEAARVLKPGGLLLVQDQTVPDDTDVAGFVNAFENRRDPSHNWAHSESDWRSMFRVAGLSIEHVEQIVKRHNLASWAEIQGGDKKLIAELRAILCNAPTSASEWLQPQDIDEPDTTFANHHIIIAGRKPVQVTVDRQNIPADTLGTD